VGTFDISILDIDSGVIEVRSTDGNTRLGGDNLDEALINFIADEFKKSNGVDLRKDVMALARLRETAEKAKIELSSSSSTEINLPYITVLDNVPQHLTKTLTKSDFERIVDDIVKRSIEPCERAIQNSGFSKSELSDVLLVGGSTRVPLVQDYVKKVFGKDGNKSVNPDEVVAVGAAIQGAVLSGDKTDILLLDVVALSYGIETMGSVFTKMIEANTTIPTTKKETFSTASDNQTAVTINIAQGERPMFSQNKFLGTFNLDGIMPAQRGTPKIEVELNIDANGILKVSAKDLATGKDNHITIQGNSNLSKEDIAKMKAEAEANKEADEKLRKEVNTLNEADSLIFNTEKQIKEFGDKVKDNEKTDLEEILSRLKTAHSSKSFDDITKIKEELQQKWYSVSARIYAETQQQGQQNTTNSTDGKDTKSDNVEDVNFEEVK
jgi:molecular chaperone DnaK